MNILKSLNSVTDKEQAIEKLKTELELLGLNPQESSIVALLLCTKKSMTIKDISEEVNIPNYLLYNILNLLTQKGYIEQISLKPKSYVSDQMLLQQSTEIFEQEIYSLCDSYRSSLKKGENEVFHILGLDEDQKDVYKILFSKPKTRKDLSKDLNLSYEKVRTITENLYFRKFIQKKMKGKSILYFPVPLSDIVDSEIQNLKSKLEERSNRMDLLFTCLGESGESSIKETKTSNQINVLENHTEIHRKVELLSNNSTEILSTLFIEMNKDFSNWKDLIEVELIFALKLIENGTKIKWLVNKSFIEIFKDLDTKIIHQTLKSQVDFSIKVVQSTQFSNRFIIIEEQNYFEFPKSSEYLNKAIHIVDKNISMVKKHDFLKEWSAAVDFRSYLSEDVDSEDNIILFLEDQGNSTRLKSFKIAFLGNKGVGKTSLIHRQINGYYDPHIKATLGILINETIIKVTSSSMANDQGIKLILFDFAGQELFRSYYANEYDKDAYVIVFSMNDKKSFLELDTWIDDVIENSKKGNKPLIFLLGTKFDLPVEVPKEMIWDIRKKYQIEYFYETSALTGQNISHFFKRLAELLIH